MKRENKRIDKILGQALDLFSGPIFARYAENERQQRRVVSFVLCLGFALSPLLGLPSSALASQAESGFQGLKCSELVTDQPSLSAEADPRLASGSENVADLLANQKLFIAARDKAMVIEKVFASLNFGQEIRLDYAHEYSPAWVYGPGEGPGFARAQPRRLDYWLIETFPFLFSLQHKDDPEFGQISEITVSKPYGLMLPLGHFSTGLVPIAEEVLNAEANSGYDARIQRKLRKSYPKDIYRSR